MEDNFCDVNNLDADVLLPPRKRLLAGLKKQSFDSSSHMSASTDFDDKLKSLMKSHLNKSPEELLEVSVSEAEAADKAAKTARAAAENKAEVASKAMANAKSALEKFATISDGTSSREKYLKKNKMKRQVPVEMLYNKKQRTETDEELARDLHREINSFPRSAKNASTSDLKSIKHKSLVKSLSSQKLRCDSGGMTREENRPPLSNGNVPTKKLDIEGPTQGADMVRIDESISKLDKVDRLKMTNGEAVLSSADERMKETSEEPSSSGRKRGRIKQKKLPLSVCNFRDQENPNQHLKHRRLSLTEENVGKDTANNKHMFSVGPASSSVMPIERPATWKCKEFKAPASVKQNKVMQL